MAAGRFAISVGRRIAFLIIAEALMMGVLIGHVFHALSSLGADLEYSKRFVLSPTEAIPRSLEQVAAMRAELELQHRRNDPLPIEQLQQVLEEVDQAARQYRAEWMAADSPSADARRFREELAQTDQLSLLRDERTAMTIIEDRVARLRDDLAHAGSADLSAKAIESIRELHRGLRLLLVTNIRYIAVDHSIQEARAAHTRTTLVSLGLVSLVLSVLLGLHIRNAIGPRLAVMARKVRTFQETGDYARTPNPGNDEIAVLANALDVGFSAIRERDRERERFLAVAAHELKTPLTSIVGFIEAAIASRDPALRERALGVVRRQAGRLGRLVQDLLWAASARTGQLAFQPKPIEARGLVHKVLGEIESAPHRFEVAGEEVFLLADEDLLGHALWQILSYASAIAEKARPIRVTVSRSNALGVIHIALAQLTIDFDELEHAFLPFASVQYEDGGLRYAVGLYLSREIARLHGGTLRATNGSNGEATLLLELPA